MSGNDHPGLHVPAMQTKPAQQVTCEVAQLFPSGMHFGKPRQSGASTGLSAMHVKSAPLLGSPG